MKATGVLLVLLALQLAYTGIAQKSNTSQSQNPEPKKQPKEIELLHADKFKVDKTTPKGASKLVGNVRLQHEQVLMFCDSAYLYDNNSLDAFGRVKIIDGDSLTMTSDSLFYDGDKRLAKMRGNVVIDNKASILQTPFLDYYRETGMAHYYGGGEIDSQKEKIHLVSKSGYYFNEAKRFHFKGDVVMNHPDYVIVTDTMHYEPDREKTWFYGPTNITSESKEIYCEYGWFDQLTEKAQFVKNAQVNSSGQILKGDTIDRDQAAEIGIAKCNVVLLDTNEKFEVHGDYAIYHEKDSTSLVTQNMMLLQDMDGDTFFLVADTLYSLLDTSGKRLIRTFHNNRFFKQDMQGACDSLVYHTADSIIFMYFDPVLWSDANQITADSIKITMRNEAIDKMYMDKNAFIIAQEDSIYFNQIKGRNMIGHFKDNDLRTVNVYGNGETVYYPREEDNTLIGVNETQCAQMKITIDSNEIDKIYFYDKPTAVLTPSDDMDPQGIKMEGFLWRITERPKSKADLMLPVGYQAPRDSNQTALADSIHGSASNSDSIILEGAPEISPLPVSESQSAAKGKKASSKRQEEDQGKGSSTETEQKKGIKEED
jgi:lipopolysaccharide export system protein LptA